MVYNFIEFWSDWSFPQASNHLLLIFLTFNYKEIETSNFWQRLSKCLFRQKSINDTIKEAFRQLENESFLDKFKVNGVVLPELHNIKKEHVEDWVRNYRHDFCDVLNPEIDKFFKSPDEEIAKYNVS